MISLPSCNNNYNLIVRICKERYKDGDFFSRRGLSCWELKAFPRADFLLPLILLHAGLVPLLITAMPPVWPTGRTPQMQWRANGESNPVLLEAGVHDALSGTAGTEKLQLMNQWLPELDFALHVAPGAKERCITELLWKKAFIWSCASILPARMCVWSVCVKLW